VQDDGSVDCHPLLREYFARQLRQKHPEAWRAAHRRVYAHLCATTKDLRRPTLEDLQPLYQAVAHGCQAGLQQEAIQVYNDRILRGGEHYASRKLGAFGSELGAQACFFERPWTRLAPGIAESDQGWLLSETAFCLGALGRLTEALEPMRAGLQMGVQAKDWKEAAIRAGNLSELELTLGEVAGAVGDAEQSVSHADRSGDAFWKIGTRAKHADALHQSGHRAEAEARFRGAEQMQAERQPAYPLLYSIQGFLYCNLLLSEAERGAWQVICNGALRPPEGGDAQRAALLAVSERAAQTLKWAGEEAAWQVSFSEAGDAHTATLLWHSLAVPLENGLDHLTLGRAALYAAALESSRSDFRVPRSELDLAVNGLRRAGRMDHLPRGLLTRAWLRSLEGPRTGPESAQSDLDEALEIAGRGPMKLFMADIHLHRARLFFREAQYP
ncbi:MAG: hypothetical protein ACREX8_08560, partial [Gammaproteobacteria bacterium]